MAQRKKTPATSRAKRAAAAPKKATSRSLAQKAAVKSKTASVKKPTKTEKKPVRPVKTTTTTASSVEKSPTATQATKGKIADSQSRAGKVKKATTTRTTKSAIDSTKTVAQPAQSKTTKSQNARAHATKKASAQRTSKAASARREIKAETDDVSVATSHSIAETPEGVTIFSRVRTKNAVLLVARVIGLAFVLLGVGFSLLGVNRIGDAGVLSPLLSSIERAVFTQSAQLPAPTGSCIGPDCADTTLESPLQPSPKLSVDFDVPTSPYSGEVRLVFKTQFVDELDVKLYYYDDSRHIELGSAQPNADASIWTYDLDTTKLQDGMYKLYVNAYNTSVMSGQEFIYGEFSIENVSAALDSSVDTDETDAATTQEETILHVFTEEAPMPTELNASHRYAFALNDVSSVRAYAVNTDTLTRTLLGNATEYRSGQWYITVDPTKLDEGVYRMQLRAVTYDTTIITKSGGRFRIAQTNTVSSESATDDVASVTVTDSESATTDTAATADQTVLTASDEPNLSPTVRFYSPSNQLRGYVTIFAEVDTKVRYAELYVRPKGSRIDRFVTLGTEVEPNVWRFQINTRNIPNGEYDLFTKHRYLYGDFTSSEYPISVQNTIEITTDKETVREQLYDAAIQETDPVATALDLEPAVEPLPESPDTITQERPRVQITDIETEEQQTEERSDSEEERRPVRSLSAEERAAAQALRKYEREMRALVRSYTMALRSGDDDQIAAAKAAFTDLKQRIEAEDSQITQDVSFDDFSATLDRRIERLTQDVERTEQIVRERDITLTRQDSDNDGISDFDEVNLYSTDPFTADSDGDGYSDGAEVVGGFDPTDPERETAIVYESPKESGLERDDILVVEALVESTVPADAPEASDGVSDDAVLSNVAKDTIAPLVTPVLKGRGLPNSFVTLYIFSSPLVVTVRTNDDGSWSYRLVKELDDGEHEVYVGMTDNSGKIIAKSAPFRFVKEAEAFTPVDAEAASVVTDVAPPSIVNSDGLLVAGGAVVTTLGLVLLLISLFWRRDEEVAPATVVHG